MDDREYTAYWGYAEEEEQKLLQLLAREYGILFDEIAGIVPELKSLSDPLRPNEVRRLHRQAKRWREEGAGEFRELELYLRDLERRSRIHKQEAIYIILFALYAGISRELLRESGQMFDRIHMNSLERYGVSRVKKIDFTQELLPDGTTLRSQLRSYASYSARRTAQTILLGGKLSPVVKASKNRILSKTKAGHYHGYLDQVAAAVVGYSVMEAFKQTGAKRYKFIAVLDKVTTDICRSLDGKIFRVDEMKLGVNVPPIVKDKNGRPIPHPCRSMIRLIE